MGISTESISLKNVVFLHKVWKGAVMMGLRFLYVFVVMNFVSAPAKIIAEEPKAGGSKLTLQEAVSMAQEQDPWIEGSHFREQAMVAHGLIAKTFPNPRASLAGVNVPVESFDFSQEPMTQFKMSMSQMIPRGKTRELKHRLFLEESAEQPHRRQDRKAKIAVIVSHLWLEVYRNREAMKWLEKSYVFFEHLRDITQSHYASAAGKIQQQDLLRAQLELTRLDDRRVLLQQKKEVSRVKLSQWLPHLDPSNIRVDDTLPVMKFHFAEGLDEAQNFSQVLRVHPHIISLDQKIRAAGTHIELARQKYKSQWMVSASYGYRGPDSLGKERSDFFSLGVGVDIPIFTSRLQSQGVEAAQATELALRTDKVLALRSMGVSIQAAGSRLKHLNQRKKLYEERLLKQVQDQVDSSLIAYRSNAGDFIKIMRARIAELKAQIDFLDIKVDLIKTIIELNYLLYPGV